MSRCSLPCRWSADTPSTSCRSASTSRSPEGQGVLPRVVDEAHASDELHREETPLVLDEEFVEADQVRVRHIGETAELALQAIEVGRAGAEQGLERDDLVTDAVVHLVDDAHAARTQPPHHLEAPGAWEVLFAAHGRHQFGRSVGDRACVLVRRQQPRHFRTKVGIARAGAIDVRLARGWRLQQGLVEDRAKTPMPVGRLGHRRGSLQGSPARSTKPVAPEKPIAAREQAH